MPHALRSPQSVDQSSPCAHQRLDPDANHDRASGILMAMLPEPGMTLPLAMAVSILADQVPYPYARIALAIHRGMIRMDPFDDLTEDVDLVLRRC